MRFNFISRTLVIVLSLLLHASILDAQVTIGFDLPPNQGALLDLKQSPSANGSANSTKGLGMPRVALKVKTA